MKHLKTFEENKEEVIIKQKYNEGDYVVPYKNRFLGNLFDFLSNKVSPVIRVGIDDIINMECKYFLQFDLTPDLYNSYKETDGVFWFVEKELRRATSEEIEKYKLEQNTKKYNL